MRRDELERLGPERVKLLTETGYFRSLDEQAARRRAEHDKRRQQARRTLARFRKKR